MTMYFTSDTHFGHHNLIESTRGWTNPVDHDEYLLELINETVGKQDELIICGDFSRMSVAYYRSKINCKRVRIVLGNHDRRSKMVQVFGEDAVRDSLMARPGGDMFIFCSHYCHLVWDRSHYGTFHVYGHSHAGIEADMDRRFPQRRSMDVGVDNAVRLLGEPRPFSADEILGMLQHRQGYNIVI